MVEMMFLGDGKGRLLMVDKLHKKRMKFIFNLIRLVLTCSVLN